MLFFPTLVERYVLSRAPMLHPFTHDSAMVMPIETAWVLQKALRLNICNFSMIQDRMSMILKIIFHERVLCEEKQIPESKF